MMKKILTPFDFGQTLSDLFQVEYFYIPSSDKESFFRKICEDIFDDLQYIDSQDPLIVSAYLDTIKEPLEKLKELGLQIIAIRRKVKVVQLRVVMDETLYIVAPDPCYFQVYSDSEQKLVHKLGVENCKEAEKDLSALKRGDIVFRWFSSLEVEQYFENKVPWCNFCLLSEI